MILSEKAADAQVIRQDNLRNATKHAATDMRRVLSTGFSRIHLVHHHSHAGNPLSTTEAAP